MDDIQTAHISTKTLALSVHNEAQVMTQSLDVWCTELSLNPEQAQALFVWCVDIANVSGYPLHVFIMEIKKILSQGLPQSKHV